MNRLGGTDWEVPKTTLKFSNLEGGLTDFRKLLYSQWLFVTAKDTLKLIHPEISFIGNNCTWLLNLESSLFSVSFTFIIV